MKGLLALLLLTLVLQGCNGAQESGEANAYESSSAYLRGLAEALDGAIDSSHRRDFDSPSEREAWESLFVIAETHAKRLEKLRFQPWRVSEGRMATEVVSLAEWTGAELCGWLRRGEDSGHIDAERFIEEKLLSGLSVVIIAPTNEMEQVLENRKALEETFLRSCGELSSHFT